MMNFKKALREMKENNKRMRLNGWTNYLYVYYDKTKDKVVSRMGNEISLENIKDRNDWQDYEEFQNKRLNELNEEIRKIELNMNNLICEASSKEEERKKLITECHSFKTNFTEYKDTEIKKITLITEKNGHIDHDTWYGGHSDHDGHISVCMYGEISHYGIKWDDELNSYIDYCSNYEEKEKIKILGFYDLEVDVESMFLKGKI